MQQDARISLKMLAQTLGIKINTLYYHLRKLREEGILKDFTIAIDPASIGLMEHYMIKLHLHPLEIESMSKVFVETFANYLNTTYKEFSFISIGEKETIQIIGSFWNADHFNKIFMELNGNINLQRIEVLKLTKVVTGTKVFKFLPNPLQCEQGSESQSEKGPKITEYSLPTSFFT